MGRKFKVNQINEIFKSGRKFPSGNYDLGNGVVIEKDCNTINVHNFITESITDEDRTFTRMIVALMGMAEKDTIILNEL